MQTVRVLNNLALEPPMANTSPFSPAGCICKGPAPVSSPFPIGFAYKLSDTPTTKSAADMTFYLSLLGSNTSSSDTSIAHDLHPAVHEASTVLVALEEKHAACIWAAEPACAQEAHRETHAEAAHGLQNDMRVRRGEGWRKGVRTIARARMHTGRRSSCGAGSATCHHATAVVSSTHP